MSHRWACLIGQPVGHSLSPAMHNAGFRALQIDAHYEAREVAPADLPAAIAALRAPECLGANVTIPHKESVIRLLDDLSAESILLGAVNTVVNRGGTLAGDNTDARGLARWMRDAAIQPAGQACLVLGAGGAARATVWALDLLGARSITVINRTPQRAEALVRSLRDHVQASLDWAPLDRAAEPTSAPWGVVVNATSLSHQGATPTVHPGCYSPGSVAVDLAYKDPDPGFLKAARAAGARAEHGRGMLLHQAILAFELWTGQAPPVKIFSEALAEAVTA